MNKDAKRFANAQQRQHLQRIEKFRQAWREETLSVSAFSCLYTSLEAMLGTYNQTKART
jgi:hypothetical protein